MELADDRTGATAPTAARETVGSGRRGEAFPWFSAAVVALLAVGIGLLVRFARSTGTRLPMFTVDASRAQLAASPDWVPDEWRREAAAIPLLSGRFSLFDDAAVEAIEDDLESLPWVRRVSAAERHLPRTLRLAITPRRPVVLVATGGLERLVDEDSVVLPGGTFAPEILAALPRVTRRSAGSAPPGAGVRWDDEAIADGISVALSLKSLAEFAPGIEVTEIDVTNSGGLVDPRETEILLVTSTGARIKWGRAPRTTKFGEIPAETKFANLGHVARQWPGLAGVGCVNLRYDDVDVFDDQGRWIQPAAPAR